MLCLTLSSDSIGISGCLPGEIALQPQTSCTPHATLCHNREAKWRLGDGEGVLKSTQVCFIAQRVACPIEQDELGHEQAVGFNQRSMCGESMMVGRSVESGMESCALIRV